MREFEVRYATKARGPAGHPEPIAIEIGADHWKLPRESALAWLEADNHTFYIIVDGQRRYLVSAIHNGQSWLRTDSDWNQPNLLLNLPDFPKAAP